MSLPSNALASYEAIGNREDLADVIYRIDPTETPFLSGAEKAKATAVKHEWQTQALATAQTTNAVLEGDDAAADATTVTARLSNIAQISRKVPMVSGTQQAVDHAGRGNEMSYQEMLKGLELKRDMEGSLIASTWGSTTGSDTAVRHLGSVLSWLGVGAKGNTSVSTGATTGVDPTGSDGSGVRTNGTQRAFTEAQLKNVLQAVWVNGGKPDLIMTGSFNKQVFSTFTGRSSPIEQAASKKIVAAVDAYESDFGTLKVVPNRFCRQRDVFTFQMDLWGVAFVNGRRMVSVPLSQTGDSVRRMILSEYTLEARNEKGSGLVTDLTTS
jgi:hypothetical protein